MSYSITLLLSALNRTSAVMARKSWDSVLKECRETTDYPTNVWYLHAAAVESKLFVHAGQPVEIRTPDHQERTGTCTCIHVYVHIQVFMYMYIYMYMYVHA